MRVRAWPEAVFRLDDGLDVAVDLPLGAAAVVGDALSEGFAD